MKRFQVVIDMDVLTNDPRLNNEKALLDALKENQQQFCDKHFWIDIRGNMKARKVENE